MVPLHLWRKPHSGSKRWRCWQNWRVPLETGFEATEKRGSKFNIDLDLDQSILFGSLEVFLVLFLHLKLSRFETLGMSPMTWSSDHSLSRRKVESTMAKRSSFTYRIFEYSCSWLTMAEFLSVDIFWILIDPSSTVLVFETSNPDQLAASGRCCMEVPVLFGLVGR